MPRQARLDALGTVHHIIVRGIERRRIVEDNKDRDNFVTRLGELAADAKTKIYAWSLMSNHAHLLLCSGPEGIAKFMGRFLTGYAISYNKRHRRHGHLFQNRYKSIICEENAYFTELVRYIHLNPLRAGVVKTLAELDRYRYGGHSVIAGRINYKWQNRAYVLNWFGEKEKEALQRYHEFVEAGIAEGRRPDLVGGGLVRSLGGWSEVISMRKRGEREITDERILGSGSFVERILQEADENERRQMAPAEGKRKIAEVVEGVCKREGVKVQELKAGGRRAEVSQARSEIAVVLVKDYGVSFAEVARNVGVTTSGIFRILRRNHNKSP